MFKYGLIGMLPLAVVAAASAQPGAAPAEQAEPLSARVIELEGSAFHAPATAAALDTQAWKPVKVGDEYPAGTQLRTALRTRVLLRFGDDTLVLIDRMTNASIDEFYKKRETKTMRLSLGYGKIRAGVAEGALRSDLTIDSPVATLSKRGTWGFEMEVWRGGYYRVSLAQRGLVEALERATGQRRLLSPQQYVTSMTIARTWIMQNTFDRTVSLFDLGKLTGAEVNFAALNDTGMGVVDPAGGTQTMSIAGRDPAAVAEAAAAEDEDLRRRYLQAGVLLNRPEGNFGFGGTGPLAQMLKHAARHRAALADRAR